MTEFGTSEIPSTLEVSVANTSTSIVKLAVSVPPELVAVTVYT